jgi:ribosomal protein S21
MFLRSLGSTSRALFTQRSLTRGLASGPSGSSLTDLELLNIPGTPTPPGHTSNGPLSNPKFNAQLPSNPLHNARVVEQHFGTDHAPIDYRDDKWWTSLVSQGAGGSRTAPPQPGNQYSGRSIAVGRGGDVAGAFRKLSVRLSRTGLKADVRRSEYHEKPSEKKRRLASERHRRRFQEMVCCLLRRVI